MSPFNLSICKLHSCYVSLYYSGSNTPLDFLNGDHHQSTTAWLIIMCFVPLQMYVYRCLMPLPDIIVNLDSARDKCGGNIWSVGPENKAGWLYDNCFLSFLSRWYNRITAATLNCLLPRHLIKLPYSTGPATEYPGNDAFCYCSKSQLL